MAENRTSSNPESNREVERGKRHESAAAEAWPHKLNKALVAIGVIAFGLIVTDRLLEAFRADDEPVKVAVKAADEAVIGLVVEPGSEPGIASAGPADSADAKRLDDSDSRVKLQNLFGSRVVFVSVSDPAYVVTEDSRRFELGSAVDEQTTLTGITAQQLTLEQTGDLMVISLPDPTVQ